MKYEEAVDSNALAAIVRREAWPSGDYLNASGTRRISFRHREPVQQIFTDLTNEDRDADDWYLEK